MCEPVTIGVMAVGAIASAYAAKSAARNQEKAAKFNAKMAQLAKVDAIRRGQVAEQLERQKTSALVGHQKALLAGSGAAIGEGVTALIIEDTLATGELNALQARNNGAREAWGYETQAAQFGFEADAARQQGGVAFGASLLGGASQIAGTHQQYKTARS